MKKNHKILKYEFFLNIWILIERTNAPPLPYRLTEFDIKTYVIEYHYSKTYLVYKPNRYFGESFSFYNQLYTNSILNTRLYFDKDLLQDIYNGLKIRDKEKDLMIEINSLTDINKQLFELTTRWNCN
jgi:hypothetical protein